MFVFIVKMGFILKVKTIV